MRMQPVETRPSAWGTPDGTQIPVVRINTGRAMIAVSYDEIPRLIAELAHLQYQHQKGDSLAATEK